MDRASGEDVDLWLDEGLYLDIQLTDKELEELAQRLAIQQKHTINQLNQAFAATNVTTASAIPSSSSSSSSLSSSTSPSLSTLVAWNSNRSPSSSPYISDDSYNCVSPFLPPITVNSIRRWHEAEVLAVRGRQILVRFLSIPLSHRWINVDEKYNRIIIIT